MSAWHAGGVREQPPIRPELVRSALESADVEAFDALLDEGATWGDPGYARSCANRDDVLAMLRHGRSLGARAEVLGCVGGRLGVVCELQVRWPEGAGRPDRHVFHFYAVEGGRITRIQPFDDREEAFDAAGVGPDNIGGQDADGALAER